MFAFNQLALIDREISKHLFPKINKQLRLFSNYNELKNSTVIEGDCEVSLRYLNQPPLGMYVKYAPAVNRTRYKRSVTSAPYRWAMSGGKAHWSD